MNAFSGFILSGIALAETCLLLVPVKAIVAPMSVTFCLDDKTPNRFFQFVKRISNRFGR